MMGGLQTDLTILLLTPYGPYCSRSMVPCRHISTGALRSGTIPNFPTLMIFLSFIVQCGKSFPEFKVAIRHLEWVSQLFQRTDPLQHHGHWVFTDFDLTCLEQSKMPLVVLPGAVTVAGRTTIEASVRCDSNVGQVLEWIIQDIRRGLRTLDNGKINLFLLKSLVSSISLAPALVFQLRGDWHTKKCAISKSDQIFSAEAVQAIKWATKIRVCWSSCRGYKWVHVMRAANRALPFRRNALEQIARRTLPSLTKEQIPFFNDHVLRGGMALVEECCQRLNALGASK